MSSNYNVNDNSSIYYTGKYWNDYQECLEIINERIFFNKNIDIKNFLINMNLKEFEHALILNCGNGWVERELYDFNIIKKATCVEYSQTLVNECELKKEHRNLKYICHDINTIDFDDETFDVVINFAAGHHIRYIENVWLNITRWLKKNCYFIQHDYVGPQRNQYTENQWKQMNLVNNNLIDSVKKKLNYPNVFQMILDDPTEAINSNKIIPLTYDFFDVLVHNQSGGCIAYEILTHNNELFNYEPNERKKIVNYIMNEDLKYMQENNESFFDFIIAKNSKNLNNLKDVINKNLNNMKIREELADKSFGHYGYNILKLNKAIYCNDINPIYNSYFVSGFSFIESTGRWSLGETSIFRFKINNNENINKLLFFVNPLPNIKQEVKIKINDIEDYNIIIENEQIIEIPIKINIKYPDEVIIIFNHINVKSPKDCGINDDNRKLSLYFKWFKLM